MLVGLETRAPAKAFIWIQSGPFFSSHLIGLVDGMAVTARTHNGALFNLHLRKQYRRCAYISCKQDQSPKTHASRTISLAE